jgi:type IV pilus assembly protein PilA
MKKNNENGFTIIELLIIVVVIGLLAAIAIPQFASYKQRSFDGRSQSDLRNAITVEEAYFVDNEAYTAAPSDLITLGFKASPGVNLAIALNGTGWSAYSVHNQGAYKYCFDSSNSVVGIVNVNPAAACP